MCLEDIEFSKKLDDFATHIMSQLMEIVQSEKPIATDQIRNLQKIYKLYGKRLYGIGDEQKIKEKTQRLLNQNFLDISNGERNYLLREKNLEFKN